MDGKNGWKKMKFSDFVDINPKISIEKGKEYTFVEMGIVNPNFRYVYSNLKKEYKGGGSRFQTDDVLFARITPCLENGKIAQFKSRGNGENEIGFGSTEFFVFREKEGISDQNFVFYLSCSDFIRKPAEKSMYGASGRQRADLNALKDLKIFVPTLEVQKQIAATLSAYDDLIENNTDRIKILEEIARNIFQEWFVEFQFLGNEHIELIESELGLIPKGWKVKKIKEWGEVITGKTPSKKVPENFGNYMQFIKTPDMRKSIFCCKTDEYLSKKGVESQRKKILPPKSICVSCIGTVGIVAITSDYSQTNQQINSIIPKKDEYVEYLYFTLVELKKLIESYSNAGATMSNLSKGKFELLNTIQPEKSLIKDFSKITKPIFNEIKILEQKNILLKETRDLLLPKLISGETNLENINITTLGMKT